jgi:hypothetical protein
VVEQTLHQRGSTFARRLFLAPGEAIRWHRDPFHRLSIVFTGDFLAIEFRERQMDVWFCRAQEPMPGGTCCALSILEVMTYTLSRACPGHPCPPLDLHGYRQLGNKPVDRRS